MKNFLLLLHFCFLICFLVYCIPLGLIYFGEKEDEFLRFNCSMDGTCYLERIYQKRGQCLYKGKYWRIDSVSDIELMIKIEKSSLKKEEVAKGRLLK